jgi:hypothetical protein
MLTKVEKFDICKFVSKDRYQDNKEIVNQLRIFFLEHSVFSHPILHVQVEFQKVSKNIVEQIHYDYRNAIVEIFTDALLAASLSSIDLEKKYKLPSGSKIIPRFLLMPNLIDEFGMSIDERSLSGNIRDAHYPLFEEIISTMNPKNELISEASTRLKSLLEENYNDYHVIITLLAVAELQVIYFTPFLKKIILDDSYKYYKVHGVSTIEESQASDDEHAEYLWACLALIVDQINLHELKETINTYLSLWNDFWNYQIKRIEKF